MSTPMVNEPWFRQGWPWFLISLPLSAVVAGMVTLWFALNSEHSMVVDDYYRHGKAINQRIARDVLAAQLGLQASLLAANGQLDLTLHAIQPLGSTFQYPDKLTVRAIHPSQQRFDRTYALRHLGAGRYQGAGGISAGRWRIHVEEPEGQWRLVSAQENFGPVGKWEITYRTDLPAGARSN